MTSFVSYIDIYGSLGIAGFFMLWIYYFSFFRCECGSFYHTKQEKKEFLYFVLFTLILLNISLLCILAGSWRL